MTDSQSTKICRRCKQDKPASDFKSSKRNRDGLESYCRPCLMLYHRERRAKRSPEDADRLRKLELAEQAKADGKRFCWDCERIQESNAFPATGSYCIPCHRERVRLAQANRRVRPEVKAKERKSQKQQRSTEEFKNQRRKYRQQPDVKRREHENNTRIASTEEGRQKRRDAVAKFRSTTRGRASILEYEQRPDVKAKRRAKMKRYFQSDIGKSARKKFYDRLRNGSLKPIGIPDNPHPNDAEIVRLYLAGHTSYEIANEIGKTPTGIVYRLLRNGVKLRGAWHRGARLEDRIKCLDGHLVRSQMEQTVDNWLYTHGIPHEVEPHLPFPGRKMRADFIVANIYIEIWGLIGVPWYDEKRKIKLDLYTKYSVELLEILPYHFHSNQLNELLCRNCVLK